MRPRIWWSMLVAVGAMLVLTAVAFAAGGLKPGAVYTGKSPDCGSSVAGTTCVFKFRASANGRALQFIGKTVIDTWGCQGGGGEALLGGKLKYATPIPTVAVRANGTVYASISYTQKTSTGTANHYTSKVTGYLAHAGKQAVITFHDIYRSSQGNRPCATRPVTLTAP